ncbi:MAG: iron ABC transporter permease [Photobacterium frigidiphilum]|uniref:FecCD family ABC transporter permease n=1 Tax=Photobacterium frigidiphilum TaxID=264736 RepID=UPI00300255EC
MTKSHLIGLGSCLAAVFFLVLLSLSVGAGIYGFSDAFGYLTGSPLLASDAQLAMVMDTLRIPRTLCAVIVGVSLALAASLLQSATRNPLAEPGLLGVNAGAVLGLVIGLTYFDVESTQGYLVWSGLGALAGNTVVLIIGHLVGKSHPLKLILVGVALSATFGGLSNYVLFSNQVVLDQFRFWNLGSLAAAEMGAMLMILPFLVVAVILTFALTRQLTLMQLGEQQAKSLGINTNVVRIGVLIASTLFTACAISVAGPISFVGFLSAYCARMVEPVALSLQVVFSALFGVIFLFIADILARWLIQPFEMPNGVILALIGAPVLIAVVHRGGFRTLLAVK